MSRKFLRPPKKITLLHAAVEISGIIFLFYSNLLMGEFTHSSGPRKTVPMAMADIVTRRNALIAFVTATFGFVVFNFFRVRLQAMEEDAVKRDGGA